MKNYILTIFGIAVLSAISILLIETPSEESLYLENIKGLGITKLDGPEKSVYRDIIMTMDPKTGKVPQKNLHQAIQQSKGRVNSARDFKWQQVNSEIAGRTRSLMIEINYGQGQLQVDYGSIQIFETTLRGFRYRMIGKVCQ